MEQLDFFRQFHDISIPDYCLLTSLLKPKSFKKGDLITVPGQIQRNLYFVNSGVQMSYYQDDGKIYALVFMYAPRLCAIPDSFSFQTPSKYHLTCLTDSELSYISFDELQGLVNQSQSIERLFRKMTEAMLGEMIDLHIEMRALTIEERYRSFCRKNPHLLHLVPHKYLASYLGIDPTNFSKLFNNIPF